MSEDRRERKIVALPPGSIPVGPGRMKDGRAVVIVLLRTGFLVPVIEQR